MPTSRALSPAESEAIGRLYAAASGEIAWTEAMQAVADATDAQTGTLWVGTPAEGRYDLLEVLNTDPALRADYNTHFYKLDPWAIAAPRGGPLAAHHGTAAIADASLRKTEFYNDFGRRQGLFHLVGSLLPVRGKVDAALALHRPESAAAFSETQRRSVEALLPHLQRALQMFLALGTTRHREAVAGGMLDRIPAPCIATDGGGRVTMANTAAARLDGDGLRFVAPGPHLVAMHRGDAVRLGLLIRDAAAGGAGGAVTLRRPGDRRPHRALVSPLPGLRTLNGLDQLALVLLKVAPEAALDAAVLVGLFGLTVAEAEVALAVAAGLSPDEIATERNVGLSTVRAQIRSLLTKTSALNLRDLTRELAALASTFGRPGY